MKLFFFVTHHNLIIRKKGDKMFSQQILAPKFAVGKSVSLVPWRPPAPAWRRRISLNHPRSRVYWKVRNSRTENRKSASKVPEWQNAHIGPPDLKIIRATQKSYGAIS